MAWNQQVTWMLSTKHFEILAKHIKSLLRCDILHFFKNRLQIPRHQPLTRFYSSSKIVLKQFINSQSSVLNISWTSLFQSSNSPSMDLEFVRDISVFKHVQACVLFFHKVSHKQYSIGATMSSRPIPFVSLQTEFKQSSISPQANENIICFSRFPSVENPFPHFKHSFLVPFKQLFSGSSL